MYCDDRHLHSGASYSTVWSIAEGGIDVRVIVACFARTSPPFSMSRCRLLSLSNTWTYSELSSEGTLTILDTAGLSVLNVRVPAFFIAVISLLLGLATSCILFRKGSTKFEDILYETENDLSPSLIAPEQFHSLNGGRRVIQYQERLGRNWISGVFIKEFSDDEELIIFARDAIFDRREQESWIVLRDGYMQTRKPGDTEFDVVAFTQITRPTVSQA